MLQEPVLQLRDVSKTIDNRKIIDQMNLDIFPGEVFGLLGPNGAGKTSTIRLIVGLTSLQQGDIVIHGHSIRTDFSRAISQVGAIIEQPDLYTYLTGYQNLLHFARMHENIAHDRIMEMADIVGLTNRIHDTVRSYSLGMRQRLGLAQALLHSPSLLILDEPTNGLDPAGIRETRDYLRKLAHADNTAVLISSHLLSEIELMCDRVGIVQQGKLLQTLEISELSSASQSKTPLEDAFLRITSGNVI
ncbi:ABC-2 type transport system ATP-binding protein [Fontibacillus panacisegetis]|uniref:ABC-2 type transport system ATP-binding protein n=1 Tax=Fontibacillus panacisegetis TaxID=670482 RepID=A0A1G7GRX2_9BACL|nr:ABC-2 type transport system ATP-binding protein [Fontibacillus panacisegetis]